MMKKKKVRETDLFTRVNVLLTEKQKDAFDEIKVELSLISNATIDNSCLIRAMIDFYSDKPKELIKLKSYALNTKGYEIVAQFKNLIQSGASDAEIKEKLGLSDSVIKSGRKKLT